MFPVPLVSLPRALVQSTEYVMALCNEGRALFGAGPLKCGFEPPKDPLTYRYLSLWRQDTAAVQDTVEVLAKDM